jgi:MFS family permease
MYVLEYHGAMNILADCSQVTEPKHRGKVMSYFLLGPQLGPVVGPVLGGALGGEASWRWIFGFLGEYSLSTSGTRDTDNASNFQPFSASQYGS